VKIIVTRHPALVRVLIEDGIVPADTPVVEHATAGDVAGRHVYGVLPLSLAAAAESVTEISLRLPSELRGCEMTVDQVRQYMAGVATYRVVREERP
jgi:hypothetical protein